MEAGAEKIGTVSLTFREGVQLEAVHKALDLLIRNLAPGNCPACGFMGLDLLIRAGDPVLYEKVGPIAEFEEVLDTSIARRQAGF
jgi:hypothetical protein